MSERVRCISCGTTDNTSSPHISFNKKYGRDERSWSLCAKCFLVVYKLFADDAISKMQEPTK